jgi:hypothetical protein
MTILLDYYSLSWRNQGRQVNCLRRGKSGFYADIADFLCDGFALAAIIGCTCERMSEAIAIRRRAPIA